MTDKAQPQLKIICVLGLPGSGKSTLCEKLQQGYGFSYLSVPDVLRREAQTDHFVKDLINQRIPVGDETIIQILRREITALREGGVRRLLLNGFGRYRLQVQNFDTQIQSIDHILLLDCPSKVARGRFLSRGRDSDNPGDNYARRYTQFVDNAQLFINYFESQKRSIIKVDTDGTIGVTWEKLKEGLRKSGILGSNETQLH